MDEQTFWDLVDTVGQDAAGFDRLIDALSDHCAADIRDFADHLARALYALDTPEHYRAVQPSGGSFLGARCAAVAAGARAYAKVLRAPADLGEYTNHLGDRLLPAAELAYRTSTRAEWRYETVVSPRTGSNATAWGPSWLHPHMGTTTGDGGAPQEYMVALRHVALTLDADPQWRAWWRHAGLSTLELGIVAEGTLDHLRPSADIRRYDDQLKANFTCALPTDGRGLASRAMSEVRDMFEVIREAMNLPGLPPTPPVPSIEPADREMPVTAKPLPSVPHELEPQGYLTLAQIQEFFG